MLTYLKSPWLDLLLPLSLSGLLWERSGNPAGMVWILAVWLGLKFLRWLPSQPVFGVLIGVLAVILSAVLHPVSGSAPTDLLLVLLAFAAGLQQTRDQWRIALWVVLATVIVSLPFVEFSRFNGNLDAIPWTAPDASAPLSEVKIKIVLSNCA